MLYFSPVSPASRWCSWSETSLFGVYLWMLWMQMETYPFVFHPFATYCNNEAGKDWFVLRCVCAEHTRPVLKPLSGSLCWNQSCCVSSRSYGAGIFMGLSCPCEGCIISLQLSFEGCLKRFWSVEVRLNSSVFHFSKAVKLLQIRPGFCRYKLLSKKSTCRSLRVNVTVPLSSLFPLLSKEISCCYSVFISTALCFAAALCV